MEREHTSPRHNATERKYEPYFALLEGEDVFLSSIIEINPNLQATVESLIDSGTVDQVRVWTDETAYDEDYILRLHREEE